MAKTIKRRKNQAGTQKSRCEHPATVHGIQEWYKHMFEKLGWMVLAKSKGGMSDKLISYKKSLKRLEDKIECKIPMIHCMDKKDDLIIMLGNVRILMDHVSKYL